MGRARNNIDATIDLSAIRRNYTTLCRMTSKTVGAVLKNNAYNIGAVQVFESIQDICSDFFVATFSEAMILKPYLCGHSIYILSDNIREHQDEIVEHKFIPVLNSIDDYISFNGMGEYVLNIDIGMSRLGISLDDIKTIDNTCYMRYLMGHFSNATDQDRTEYEYRTFLNAVHCLKPKKTSLSASGSFLLADRHGTDLIRVGGLMYGLEENKMYLDNIVTIKARIIQILTIRAGDCVGYDNTYVATKSMKVATVYIGYGFGLHTSMSNRGEFIIRKNGITHRCRILGLISMDVTTIDVSDVDGCSIGDEVVICDDEYSIIDISDKTHIPGHWVLSCFKFDNFNCDLKYIGI